MAPLGRVTHYFETLLFLCKLVFFNYNFHKNTRPRKKRFVSKQGQPRPHTQLKARLLTEQLKNDLFLRLHHSAHYYYRLAILPIVILTLLVNMFFLRKFPQYPFSLIFINPASVLSHIDLKQTKQINGVKFVNIGFRSVGVTILWGKWRKCGITCLKMAEIIIRLLWYLACLLYSTETGYIEFQ